MKKINFCLFVCCKYFSFMTHRVSTAAFRIGKNLNWHSLGSPLFRWRDLKINLFLNYFLARFLEKESYRMVRYGVRSESNIFRIVIVAFRLMDTTRRLPKNVTKSNYESYWQNHNVYKNRFKLGVFKYKIQGLENPIMYPFDDGAGAIYFNESKRVFSIGPFRNWVKTPIFFMDGVGIGESDPGEAVPFAAVGFSPQFYIRIVAELMVLRYTIKKSLMRLVQKRFLPQPPRVFIRSRPLPFTSQSFTNLFDALRKPSKFKNFLFSFLIFKKSGGPAARSNFELFNGNVKKLVSQARGVRKFVRRSARRSKGKFLKLKKKYFLFKKKYSLWGRKIRRLFKIQRRRGGFRKGRFNLNSFFGRLKSKKTPFKHELVYKILRSGNNRIAAKFSGFKKKYFLKERIVQNQVKNKSFFSSFFTSLIRLLSLVNFSRPRINSFLLGGVFKRSCYPKRSKKNMSTLTLLSRVSPAFKVFSYFVKKNFSKRPRFSRRKSGLFFRLRHNTIVRTAGENFFRKLKARSLKFRIIRRKYLKRSKFYFFFYFFFTNIAVFKSYKLRFKPHSVKQLYRKKKLIFFFEKRLSVFLKREVAIKFFNPLDFTSIDDLWVKSLFDSLHFVSNLYLRERLDYKPGFILSLYTMLAFKYNSPAFLGDYIANQLEWRWRKRSHAAFIRLLIYFLKGLRFNTMYSKNLINFSIGFYGKIWGKLRSGKFIIRSSPTRALPLRRVSLRTDTSFTWAQTQFGTFGIRIWIARN